jgi:hypothetical protein
MPTRLHGHLLAVPTEMQSDVFVLTVASQNPVKSAQRIHGSGTDAEHDVPSL